MDPKLRTELIASKIFIRSLFPDCRDVDFELQEERGNIDVIYKPSDYKLQITSVDGGPNRLLRRGSYDFQIRADRLVDEYVFVPIDRKIECYRGYGVSDVILLIHVLNKPFGSDLFNREIISNSTRINEVAQKSGFKSIYFVIDNPEEVIKVY